MLSNVLDRLAKRGFALATCAGLLGVGFSSALSAYVGYDDDCCCVDEFPCGVSAGVEVVILNAHESEGYAKDAGFAAGPRVWLGWNDCEGMGFRVRGFFYDQEEPSSSFYERFKLYTVDWEFTQQYNLSCHSDFLLSAGIRLGSWRAWESNNLDRIKGVGPILSLEWHRELWCDLSFYSHGRVALLYGHYKDNNPSNDSHKGLTQVTEAQLGLEWASCICDFDYFVRAGAEGQYWAGASQNDTQDFGLIGATIAAGVRY